MVRRTMVFQKGNKLTPVNTEKDFWSKVERGSEDVCWNWLASCNPRYGSFSIKNKIYLAHRLAYIYTYGSIPKGLYVLHKCNNPKCCNPKHLGLGTQKENMRQMIKDGRSYHIFLFGERSDYHKLTTEQVNEIREKYSLGGYTQQQLGKEYHTTQTNIGHIVNHKSWKIMEE